jgi:hypothetical protein
MPKKILIAFTSPASPEVEDEYNDWYNNVHVPDVVAAPGLIRGTRYRVSDFQDGRFVDLAGGHQYMVLLEADGDPDAIQKELAERSADGRIRPSSGLVAPEPPVVAVWFDQVS